MKIGLPLDSFSQWMGGMTLFLTLSEAMAQAAQGSDTQLHLIATAPANVAATLPNGAVSIPCKGTRAEGGVGAFLQATRFPEICLARDLATAARRLELDIVGPCGVDLGRDFPVPWCAHIRDLQHRRLPELFAEHERASRDSAFAKLLANSRFALTHSRSALAEIERLLPQGQTNIHIRSLPPLLPRVNDQLPGEATVRSLFGLHSPYFVSCSQQQWVHKRHEVIIQAFARVVSELPEARVKLVFTGQQGDYRKPDYRSRIEGLVAKLGLTERVHYVGFVDRALQLALTRHAVALVQASVYEESPGASGVVEAACLGTPIVASDIPANRELTIGETAYFPAGNIDALSQQLRVRLQTPGRGQRMLAAEADAINLSTGTELVDLFRQYTRR